MSTLTTETFLDESNSRLKRNPRPEAPIKKTTEQNDPPANPIFQIRELDR